MTNIIIKTIIATNSKSNRVKFLEKVEVCCIPKQPYRVACT